MIPLQTHLKGAKKHHWAAVAAFVIAFAALAHISWIGYNKYLKLTYNISSLQSELSLTSALLQVAINDTESSLASALEQEKERIGAVSQQLGNLEQETNVIAGSVGTLEKLSKTDEELLQKYSKTYFLNEHYVPSKMVAIPKENTYFERRNYQIHANVWPHLRNMINAAENAGQTLWVYSAFRSFDEQSDLKGAYTQHFGEGANQFSADQGYSEHQLGTTVDLITSGIDGTVEGFENTPEYSWLLRNAHRYGFILSYPENNSFYVFEPWHWRYIGVDFATDLYNSGRSFYDLDQREIDERLVDIFE